MSFLIVVTALGLSSFLALSSRIRSSVVCQATLTPLASIMGSGFLIIAPLLGGLVGKLAVFAIAGLLLIAFLIGSAIRYNICNFESIEHQRGPAQAFGFVSRLTLVIAYFISVVYYLKLLAAFTLNFFSIQNGWLENIIVSGVLLSIALTGMIKGLGSLENFERIAVSLNLGVIGSLLLSLIWYNSALLFKGEWIIPDISTAVSSSDLRVMLGLLIVVQGFETSRFLGEKYSAEIRVKTMKYAQLISASIYIVFVALATVLFRAEMGTDVTAILSLTAGVALILPTVLSLAAICSQFSAATADTVGVAGLIRDISADKIGKRSVYGIIIAVTLILTWAIDVNEVIALASRAFALYYALQCIVAAIVAGKASSQRNEKWKCLAFAILSVVCLSVCIFGMPAE